MILLGPALDHIITLAQADTPKLEKTFVAGMGMCRVLSMQVGSDLKLDPQTLIN